MRLCVITSITIAALLVTMGVLVADPTPQGHASVTGRTEHSVDNSVSPPKEYLEFTVHLTGLSGQKWKDLHMDLPWPYQFPKNATTNASVTGPGTGEGSSTQPWKVSTSSAQNGGRRARPRAGLNVFAGSNTKAPGFTAEGDYKVKIEVPAGSGNLPTPDATWTTTNDGSSGVEGPDIMDQGSGYLVYGGNVVANLGLDLPAPMAIATVVTCQTDPEQAGSNYKIFTSMSLSVEFSDPLGIGINSETEPLPPEWNVLITNDTGSFDPGGMAEPPPSILPQAPAGSGHEFFVVCAIMDGDEIRFSSEPIKITIQ